MSEAMQNARYVSVHLFPFSCSQLYSSSNSTQRAWQQLPRHLRRRAASHDVRRVPLKLRDKARAEVGILIPWVPAAI